MPAEGAYVLNQPCVEGGGPAAERSLVDLHGRLLELYLRAASGDDTASAEAERALQKLGDGMTEGLGERFRDLFLLAGSVAPTVIERPAEDTGATGEVAADTGWRDALAIAPTLATCLGPERLNDLSSRLAGAEADDRARLVAALGNTEPLRGFGLVLLATKLALAMPPMQPVTLAENGAFGPWIETVRQETGGDIAHERLEIARAFCGELLASGQYAPALFDYLALACENDEERALLAAIRAHLTETRHATS